MFNWWLSQFCACQDGEPDPTVLERMALLQLQIRAALVSSRIASGLTIKVPGVSGRYEASPWTIRANDMLVADTGLNQEVVRVISVNPLAAPPTLTAVFSKPHASRFGLSNTVLGNPGPQPRFDPRNPAFSGVVRYISIVE